jgi:hypothetical protein
MRIVVDIPEYLVERARRLIAAQTYRDLSSFVATSMENQLALELTPGNEELHGGSDSTFIPVIGSTPISPLQGKLAVPSGGVPILPYSQRRDRPELARWPWGQINKLLPVKFAVRLLANSLSESEPLVSLDDFRATAAEMARVFGLRLRGVDEQVQRKWGSRLSAGFPISDRTQSSLDRYANQFVGRYRETDGRLFGALFELQLGDVRNDATGACVGLTEAGVEFARARNPIIDDSELRGPLSEPEIDFYLRHIEDRVPGEFHAFALILGLIEGGISGRPDLIEQIKQRVPFDWTDSVADTYRAGAMSRMFDLDLLTKTKNGLTVQYGVTHRGMAWLHAQQAGGAGCARPVGREK